MTGILQSDGTYCRKGLNCKRHGNAMRAFFEPASVNDEVEKSHGAFLKGSVVRKGLVENPSPDMDSVRQQALEWRAKLTDQESRELDVYRMTKYVDINAYLYKEKDFESGSAQEFAEKFLKPSIANIDSALSKSSLSSQPKTLYRTFKVADSMKYLEGVSEGGVVDFPSYTSTTMDSDIVNDRTKNKNYKNVVVFEMITRKGAYIPHDEDEFDKNSVQYREQEVLLPRGLKFRVVKKYKKVAYESSSTYDSYGIHAQPQRKTFAVIQLEEIE